MMQPMTPVRVAMWSGPRNVSTAMMRAFGARADCAVSDEPFYAAYLAATGLDHPMRDAVIASQPTDWRDVASAVLGPVPGGNEQSGSTAASSALKLFPSWPNSSRSCAGARKLMVDG